MSIQHDGQGMPVLDKAWGIGDVDALAFVWDGMLGEGEQILSSQWLVGDDWLVRAEFNSETLSQYGVDYSNVYAVLLECTLTESDIKKHYRSTQTLAAVTHRVVISGGRELSRTVLVPIIKF